MPFDFDMAEKKQFSKKSIYKIKVIGVGGAGNNAVQRMVKKGIQDVELIVANTDVQVLELNNAPTKLQLGKEITRGLGAGGDPDVGKNAAMESADDIRAVLEGTDLLFLMAGLGGGTGTGAAPVIAKIAKEMDILTVGIVTIPFHFEGISKQKISISGLDDLKDNVDSLIKISNDKLAENTNNVPIDKAFENADEILYQAITGISDLITKPGIINLDFADVANVLKIRGSAMLGIGEGSGPRRAEQAIEAALKSRFLDEQVKNATAALVNITGKNPTMEDLKVINEILRSYAVDDAKLKMGISYGDLPEDRIKVTVVASGYDRLSSENEDNSDVYEQPALFRMFGKSVIAEEITKLNNYLNENKTEVELTDDD